MAPRNPQSSAYLTPMASSPRPKISPKVALTIACISRKRLTRCPASSTNLVAATILPWPASRMIRLRSSSRFSSMKMTRMIASASSPRYSSSGLRNEVSRDIQTARCGSMITAVGAAGPWADAAPSSLSLSLTASPPSSLLMSVIIS